MTKRLALYTNQLNLSSKEQAKALGEMLGQAYSAGLVQGVYLDKTPEDPTFMIDAITAVTKWMMEELEECTESSE